MNKLFARLSATYSPVSRSILDSNYLPEIIHFAAYILIVCIQTAYYFLYSRFTLEQSVFWSLLDWSIWFVLFLTVFYSRFIWNVIGNSIARKLIFFVLICISFPIFHATIGLYIYSTLIEIEGEFYENLIDLISRRWFLNLLISAVCAIGFGVIKTGLEPIGNKQYNSSVVEQIVLKDGVNVYQFYPFEIHWISTARNYIIIETIDNQVVIRMTLNSIFAKLSKYGFIKISRSTIVNKDFVRMIKKKSQYSQTLIMKNGRNFPIGRTYLKSVKNILTNC